MHIAGEYTSTYLNPAGTFENFTIYGMGQDAIWAAYITGDNERPDQPNVVFDHFNIWNAALRAYIYAYHTNSLTIDHALMLSDVSALTRPDWGVLGLTLANYESLATTVDHSDIEGMYIGMVSPSVSTSPYGLARTPTIIRNTTMKNLISVDVAPTTGGSEDGNAVELDNDLFSTMTLTNAGSSPTSYAIYMGFGGPFDPRDLSRYSLVYVNDYNQVSGDDFQVFYHEQAANAIMPASDPTWYSRLSPSRIGAPGGFVPDEPAGVGYLRHRHGGPGGAGRRQFHRPSGNLRSDVDHDHRSGHVLAKGATGHAV